MNRKDPMFKELNSALQVRYRELREGGVGAVVKHAAVVLSDEEQALWGLKVIGDHDPLALQRAVFFYVGKTFCLRGGQEQCGLKPSQLLRKWIKRMLVVHVALLEYVNLDILCSRYV